MNETPFPDGSEPRVQPPDGGQPAPYTPLMPPALHGAQAFASPPRRGGRRRWLWLLGAVAAVAVILALGFVAGLAMVNARAAGGSPVGLFQPRGPNHGGPRRGAGPAARGAFGLTVIKVSGQTITATGRGGKSVTIHVTASTHYARAGKTVSLSAITAGEQIAVVGKRNSDGSIAATRVSVVLPGYRSSVTAVSGSTINISDRQTTHIIHVSGATAYLTDGAASSLSAVVKGVAIEAVGTKNADGSLNAEVVEIEYPRLGGAVTAVTATSITVSGPRGTQVIHVSASTIYARVTLGANGPTNASATLSAVKAGVFVLAEGLLNSDSSLNARSVTIMAAPSGAPWGRPWGGLSDGPQGGAPSATGATD